MADDNMLLPFILIFVLHFNLLYDEEISIKLLANKAGLTGGT